MDVRNFVVGCFNDEKNLFPAVKDIRKKGYVLHDVYTPFPMHGLDKAMGLRDTSLHIAGFIYGITGTTLALSFMSWVFTRDWPMNIGGKPHLPIPAFIPITFETTVLFASVGMVLTFCYLCQIAPFVKRHHFHERATDDLFVVVIETNERSNTEEIKTFFKNAGAVEVNEQEVEAGWWLGRYDRQQDLYSERMIEHAQKA
jgi:hypothetical protein